MKNKTTPIFTKINSQTDNIVLPLQSDQIDDGKAVPVQKEKKKRGVYGKLVLVSPKIKSQEKAKEMLLSKDVWKYKALILKNKLKLIDKTLSALKPVICLNNIKSIDTKNTTVTGPTRKILLKKYLMKRITKKCKEQDLEIDPELIEKYVPKLMTEILNSNIDFDSVKIDLDKLIGRFYMGE